MRIYRLQNNDLQKRRDECGNAYNLRVKITLLPVSIVFFYGSHCCLLPVWNLRPGILTTTWASHLLVPPFLSLLEVYYFFEESFFLLFQAFFSISTRIVFPPILYNAFRDFVTLFLPTHMSICYFGTIVDNRSYPYGFQIEQPRQSLNILLHYN